MLEPVPLPIKHIDDYRSIVGDARIDEILALAAPLRGLRVLHVNATAFGGGVAELLTALVPLMRSVGLDAEWRLMAGSPELWEVTKALHNLLQGAGLAETAVRLEPFLRPRGRIRERLIEACWTPGMAGVWQQYNQLTAELFEGSYDIVIVHDPQPAGLPYFLEARDPSQKAAIWIWRCHIDLTRARPDIWSFLRTYLTPYDAAIFTMQGYVKPDTPIPEIALIAPAIDPLSTKNIDLDETTIHRLLNRFGIDPTRPIICQVSRFDPWKDPLGLIDVYRRVRRDVPGLQLLLVGAMASDDPEGIRWFELTARRAGEDPDIHLLTNMIGVGNLEVNAFQRSSHVVLQKSIREGFALTVSEALWKGRPVVATAVGGIPLQVSSGYSGYLVKTNADCVARTRELLLDPALADRLGANGRERVRENFLITRYLADYLQLFSRLRTARSAAAPAPARLPEQR